MSERFFSFNDPEDGSRLELVGPFGDNSFNVGMVSPAAVLPVESVSVALSVTDLVELRDAINARLDVVLGGQRGVVK